MIIRPISDLHTEFWPENPRKAIRLIERLIPPLQEDPETVLLLAGDTGSRKRGNIYKAVVDHLCDRFRLVADIPGNHYWYGGRFIDAEPPTTRPNYVFGETFVHENIVAATLWADFQRGNPIVEEACRTGMNDFKQISGLTVDAVKDRHAAHAAFLRASIRPGCVVMTHFAPSWQSIPPHFQTDIRNGHYASDLEGLILDAEPAIWLHGHIHTACDYEIGKTRVICNPAGYDGKDHDPRLTISLS